MATFGYLAVDKNGKRKKGSYEANDKAQVKEFLKRDELIAIEISEQNFLTKEIDLPFLDRVKPRDLSVFCRQFVSIVSAGISVGTSLSMLAQQTQNKRLKKAAIDTHRQIEKGETLADAMRMQGSSVFPPMLCNMVAAGEASGNLENSFERMATHFEKDSKTKGAVKKAMIYPIIVLIVIIIVLVVLLTTVIPSFSEVFTQMDMELPAITKAILAISDFLTTKWWLLIIILVALAIGIKAFKDTDKGKHFFARLSMKIPLFGNLTVKNASARFARTASTLLSSGLPMLDVLEICAKNMSNVVFRDALYYARDEVSAGVSLAKPLERSKIFPPMVYHLVSIGEETGELEEMLDKLSDYYDEEVDMAVKSLMAALEPMIILLMSCVVGFVVIGVLMPMFTMYEALGTQI